MIALFEELLGLVGSKDPGGSDSKEYACSAGEARDMSSIPGSGRPPREGHGNPL